MSQTEREDRLNGLLDELYWKFVGVANETLAQRAAGHAVSIEETDYPLPIIRAAREDYARIVSLWKEYQGHRPIDFGRAEASGSAPVASPPARDCPGCGSARHHMRFVSHDLYPFHVCEECGTLFVPYAIEEDFIEAFLTAVPEARVIADRMMAGRDRETMASDHERFDAYFALAEAMANGAPDGQRYLDIGCGVGHSIDAARERGYDAVGLEISRTALTTARARGRNCHHPDEWRDEGKFELVTLFETLEHVATPFEMLASAQSRLSEKGLLLVTVPNGASWEASLLSDRSVHVYGGFDGVGHINLFTPEGLSALMRQAGFEPLLFDGQFGNNALLLLSQLLDVRQGALSATGEGEIKLRLPQPLQRLLLSAGPALTALDRADLRSPILVALACRQDDSPHFTQRLAELERARNETILAGMPEEPPDTTPKLPVPQDLPLFDGKSRQPLPKLMDGALASTFRGRGANGAVRTGLCVRSYAPLKFDTVIRLGGGRLGPGNYEIAIAALMRSGAAALGVLDEGRGEWIAIGNIEPTEYWMRQAFRIERKTKVSLVITANNVEPAEVDLELFDAGVARVL